MLTPIEVQGKTFKTGFGYDKKDVDPFVREVLQNYEKLYKENIELNDKITMLNEGIAHYKTIETTLQKALVLAEKAAEETKQAAKQKALSIVKEAHAKANMITAEGKEELNRIHLHTVELVQQYNKYKIQFEKLAQTQIELLNSNGFNINIANLDVVLEKGLKDLDDYSNKESTMEEEIDKEIKENEIDKESVKEDTLDIEKELEPLKDLKIDSRERNEMNIDQTTKINSKQAEEGGSLEDEDFRVDFGQEFDFDFLGLKK